MNIMKKNDRPTIFSLSRRQFVTTSAAAAAGIMTAGNFAYARGSDNLRVGLIGCGGRGTGAAKNNLEGTEGTVIVAMADLYQDRLDKCRESLAKLTEEQPEFAERIQVKDDLCFVGFDAYKQLLAQDIDIVLIATPPAFRPVHVEEAVNQGKHIFMEKPVAVDAAGVRSIIASSEKAEQKGLAIVAGTQRRHDFAYNEAMKRIHEGAIGDVMSGQVFWNQGGLWMHPREEQWTDMEWQTRNWLYFTWLSGDHIVEQHIHNIDVANWAMQAHPVSAVGVGGRQSRTDPAYGHIYDHFCIDFEYPNGGRVLSMCRQIDGTASNVSEHFIGTKGSTNGHGWIKGENAWRWDSDVPKTNPYVQEHTNLVSSIRDGKVLNEGKRVAESTLSAIMGREAAYTGQVITWDELINAEMDLVPKELAFGSVDVPPVPMPGQTMLNRTI